MAWNEQAVIECQFRFTCPKVWDNLQPTQQEGIRHCPECNRDVHLALTEEDFRRHADGGHCVAVRVLHPVLSGEDRREAYVVGKVNVPYNSHVSSQGKTPGIWESLLRCCGKRGMGGVGVGAVV